MEPRTTTKHGLSYAASEAAKLVTVCAIAICVVLGVAWVCGYFSPSEEAGAVSPAERPGLPSISEFQATLNEQYGAKLKVDGKLGKATQAAWDAAYNNQMAIRMWPNETQD